MSKILSNIKMKNEEINKQNILDILSIGIKAISPYNIQPWRFKIKNNKVQVYLIKENKGFMKNNDIYYISLGCLLENIAEATNYFNYTHKITYLSEKIENENPQIKIEFKQNQTTNNHTNSIKHVLSRYTNRKQYLNKKVPKYILKEIKSIYESKTAKVQFIENNLKFNKTYSQFERIRFNNNNLFEELVDHVRFNKKDNLKYKDNLDIKVLETNKFTTFIMKNFKNPIFHKLITILRFFGAGKEAGNYMFKLLNSSPIIISFSEKNRNWKNIINCGINIQKILNYIHKEKLSSQICNSGLALFHMQKNELTSEKEKKNFSQAKNEISKILNQDLKTIDFILRLGYAKEAKVKSLRRNIEELIIEEK
ncbi:MAG: hypothetical protein KC550_04405 [Nanoarchaeota archaeon]|nr:hypothetical protein [Nanoarchaeota archaeon]